MLNSAFIKHMDVEFAILAKNLTEKWTDNGQMNTIAQNDEDTMKVQSDFGGGLC